MNVTYIDIHTHRRRDEGGVEVTSLMAGCGARPPGLYSVGIHPWQVGTLDATETVEALDEVATSPAWAVGEIGLDFVWVRDHGGRTGKEPHENPEMRSKQEAVFEAQLAIAGARALPVIIHCVRAFERTMEILERHKNLRAVIFHGFVGSPRQAARAVAAGYYLSVGERSLRSPKTVESIKLVSLDNLFAETDESPVPIAEIYARVAKIKQVTVKELARKIKNNYARLA